MRNLRPRKATKKEYAESESPEPEEKKTTTSRKAKTTTDKKSKPASKVASEPKGEPQDNVDNESEETDMVIYNLSEKELKEINNAFDMNCSDDHDELLGSEDLKTAIRSLGYEPRADEIKKLLKKFSNKAGKVNRDGFQKIMAQKMGSTPGAKDNFMNDAITKVFDLLDLDKTGFITLENLKSISKELNEEITDEELHEMMKEADEDGDFQISKHEFCNIMKKTSLY